MIDIYADLKNMILINFLTKANLVEKGRLWSNIPYDKSITLRIFVFLFLI